MHSIIIPKTSKHFSLVFKINKVSFSYPKKRIVAAEFLLTYVRLGGDIGKGGFPCYWRDQRCMGFERTATRPKRVSDNEQSCTPKCWEKESDRRVDEAMVGEASRRGLWCWRCFRSFDDFAYEVLRIDQQKIFTVCDKDRVCVLRSWSL